MQTLDLLILGAGWTSTFLTPLLSPLSYAQTSTTGRPGTIKFTFDPSLPDQTPSFSPLPSAHYILLTFPVPSASAASLMLQAYAATHPHSKAKWIILGSTGAWQPGSRVAPISEAKRECWVTRHSPLAKDNARAKAEGPFLDAGATVLHLAGLYGAQRRPREWLARVAPNKASLAEKGSLHLIHGEDVARGVLAVIKGWTGERCAGQRWMLTDGWVYDWWGLAVEWDAEGKGQWVRELMEEKEVRALPRSVEEMGRGYDSREFWRTFGTWPVRGRVE